MVDNNEREHERPGRETPANEAVSRLQRINELVERRAEQQRQEEEREAERRRKRLKLYWGLLVAALLLAILTMWAGYRDADAVAAEVADDSDFQEKLDQRIDERIPTRESVAVAVVNDLDFREQVRVLAAPTPESLKPMQDLLIRQMRLELTQPSPPATALVHEVRQLQVQQAEFDRALRENARGGLNAIKIKRTIDEGLEQVRREVTAVSKTSEAQGDRVKELVAEVEALRKMLLPSISYVVKENAESYLPELELMVKLGSRKGNVVEGVQIFLVDKRVGQVRLYPEGSEASSTARLGQPFTASTDEYRYILTLGYSVNRWVARDLIGLEVRRIAL